MNDTDVMNGAHDAHEHNGISADTDAQTSEVDAIRTSAERGVARHRARIDQLTKERERINDQIAAERAEVERFEAILGWNGKTVQPRGKRRAAQPAKGRK